MLFRSILFVLLLHFCTPISVVAQPDRVPEYEIKEQEKFIEATKFKLINRLDKAEPIFLDIYKENRDNHAAAFELARIYMSQEKEDEAKKYIKIAIDKDPNNVWYLQTNAEYLEQMGLNGDSADMYRRIAQINPNNFEVFEKWAYNELKNGDGPAAVSVYNQMEVKYGISENTSRKKFTIYKHINDQKNALIELKKISDYYPTNVTYLNNLAGYHKEIGNNKEAANIYKKVLAIDPQDPYALIGTSEKENILDDTPAYLASLKTLIQNPAIDIDHKVKELSPYVAKAGDNAQEDQILVSVITELANAHSEDAKAHAIQGDVLMNTRQYKSAIQAYNRTLELDKRVYPVWEQLMFAQNQVQDYLALLKTSDKALNYFPNQGRAYFFNGLALHFTGDYVASDDILQEATMIAASNTNLKLDIYQVRAKNNIALKTYAEAKALCLKGLALNEKHIGILETTGDIELFLNNQDEAIRYWEKAIKAGGDKNRLEKKITGKQIIE